MNRIPRVCLSPSGDWYHGRDRVPWPHAGLPMLPERHTGDRVIRHANIPVVATHSVCMGLNLAQKGIHCKYCWLLEVAKLFLSIDKDSTCSANRRTTNLDWYLQDKWRENSPVQIKKKKKKNQQNQQQSRCSNKSSSNNGVSSSNVRSGDNEPYCFSETPRNTYYVNCVIPTSIQASNCTELPVTLCMIISSTVKSLESFGKE